MRFRRTVSDIKQGRYLDRYATLSTAFVVAVLSALGITDERVTLTVVLACLVILGLGEVETTRTLELLRSAAFAPPGRNRLLVMSSESYRPYIREAKCVRMLALANYQFLASNNAEFGKLLDAGGEIRLLMLHPESDWGLRAATARSLGASQTSEHIVTHVELTVEKLSEFAERAARAGQVEAMQTPYPAPFLLTMFEFSERDRIAMLVPSGFRQPLEVRPTIIIEEDADRQSVEFLFEYFDNLWNWEENTVVQLS